MGSVHFNLLANSCSSVWNDRLLLKCMNKYKFSYTASNRDNSRFKAFTANLQKFLSSFCSPQTPLKTEEAGTGYPDPLHCMHCDEEFALLALAACHKPFPPLSCLDLVAGHEISFDHGGPSLHK